MRVDQDPPRTARPAREGFGNEVWFVLSRRGSISESPVIGSDPKLGYIRIVHYSRGTRRPEDRRAKEINDQDFLLSARLVALP
jgi:hypothetical protein